jgi:hypothetical protein
MKSFSYVTPKGMKSSMELANVNDLSVICDGGSRLGICFTCGAIGTTIVPTEGGVMCSLCGEEELFDGKEVEQYGGGKQFVPVTLKMQPKWLYVGATNWKGEPVKSKVMVLSRYGEDFKYMTSEDVMSAAWAPVHEAVAKVLKDKTLIEKFNAFMKMDCFERADSGELAVWVEVYGRDVVNNLLWERVKALDYRALWLNPLNGKKSPSRMDLYNAEVSSQVVKTKRTFRDVVKEWNPKAFKLERKWGNIPLYFHNDLYTPDAPRKDISAEWDRLRDLCLAIRNRPITPNWVGPYQGNLYEEVVYGPFPKCKFKMDLIHRVAASIEAIVAEQISETETLKKLTKASRERIADIRKEVVVPSYGTGIAFINVSTLPKSKSTNDAVFACNHAKKRVVNGVEFKDMRGPETFDWYKANKTLWVDHADMKVSVDDATHVLHGDPKLESLWQRGIITDALWDELQYKGNVQWDIALAKMKAEMSSDDDSEKEETSEDEDEDNGSNEETRWEDIPDDNGEEEVAQIGETPVWVARGDWDTIASQDLNPEEQMIQDEEEEEIVDECTALFMQKDQDFFSFYGIKPIGLKKVSSREVGCDVACFHHEIKTRDGKRKTKRRDRTVEMNVSLKLEPYKRLLVRKGQYHVDLNTFKSIKSKEFSKVFINNLMSV